MVNLICDYSCEYCFSSAPKDPSLVGKLSPRAYADFFDSTGKTWLLHLSGGEPFAYHGLVELCVALARNHRLSINSNLTSKRVRAFAQAVDRNVSSTSIAAFIRRNVKSETAGGRWRQTCGHWCRPVFLCSHPA